MFNLIKVLQRKNYINMESHQYNKKRGKLFVQIDWGVSEKKVHKYGQSSIYQKKEQNVCSSHQ